MSCRCVLASSHSILDEAVLVVVSGKAVVSCSVFPAVADELAAFEVPEIDSVLFSIDFALAEIAEVVVVVVVVVEVVEVVDVEVEVER